MPCNRLLSIYSHNILKQFNRSKTCDRINSVSSVTQLVTSTNSCLISWPARLAKSWQPRSQGLSSLPPLVVGRKTLVAAGHVPSCDTNFSTGVGSPTIFVDLNWSERKVLRSKFSSPVVSFTQVRWDILICIYLAYQLAAGRSVYY